MAVHLATLFFIHVHFVQYIVCVFKCNSWKPMYKTYTKFSIGDWKATDSGTSMSRNMNIQYVLYVWCCQKTPPLQLLCGIYIISNFIYKASQRYFIWPVYEIKINWNHTAGILKSFVLFIEPKKTIPLLWWDWPFKEIQKSFRTVNSLYKHYKQFSC